MFQRCSQLLQTSTKANGLLVWSVRVRVCVHVCVDEPVCVAVHVEKLRALLQAYRIGTQRILLFRAKATNIE